MIKYRRLGKTDYLSQAPEKLQYSPTETLSPQSKNKFRDFLQLNHIETSPEALGLVFPYPEIFTASDGSVWKRFDVATNNDFLQNTKRDRIPYYTTDKGNTFDPFWKDKDAKIERPGTTAQGYNLSSTWGARKKRGEL